LLKGLKSDRRGGLGENKFLEHKVIARKAVDDIL
jgi:hypothetical protein